MQVECYKFLSAEHATEWQEFLSDADHQHPRQDLRFADIERAEGADILFAMGRQNEKLCAIGLFTLSPHKLLPKCHSSALCLSGPVCDHSEQLGDFMDSLVLHPMLKRVGQVKITPYWMANEGETLAKVLANRGWTLADPEPCRQTGWVDITPLPEQIFASFSKSARREVRRAGRQDIQLSTITDSGIALDFLDSLNRLRTNRGLPAIGKAGFLESFGSIYKTGDTGVILGAFHSDTLTSGLLLYRSKDVAHGRHFTTEPELLRKLGNLRIAPFLWLEGMKWARAHGCTKLDVEGYRVATNSNDNKYNIYKYKSEYNPVPITRIAEHKQRTNTFIDLTGNGKSILKAYIKKRLGK